MTRSTRCPVNRQRGLALASLALAACSAHAEIPEVVVTQSEIVFDGIGPELAALNEPRPLSTSFDHPEGFEMPDFIVPELRPLGATITARDPGQDLSFIQSFRLTIGTRAPDGPEPAELATYERTSMDDVNLVEIIANSDADILEYWETESAYYLLQAFGSMPEDAWEVDVAVRFAGSLTISSQ